MEIKTQNFFLLFSMTCVSVSGGDPGETEKGIFGMKNSIVSNDMRVFEASKNEKPFHCYMSDVGEQRINEM